MYFKTHQPDCNYLILDSQTIPLHFLHLHSGCQ